MLLTTHNNQFVTFPYNLIKYAVDVFGSRINEEKENEINQNINTL